MIFVSHEHTKRVFFGLDSEKYARASICPKAGTRPEQAQHNHA